MPQKPAKATQSFVQHTVAIKFSTANSRCPFNLITQTSTASHRKQSHSSPHNSAQTWPVTTQARLSFSRNSNFANMKTPNSVRTACLHTQPQCLILKLHSFHNMQVGFLHAWGTEAFHTHILAQLAISRSTSNFHTDTTVTSPSKSTTSQQLSWVLHSQKPHMLSLAKFTIKQAMPITAHTALSTNASTGLSECNVATLARSKLTHIPCKPEVPSTSIALIFSFISKPVHEPPAFHHPANQLL